MRLGVARLRCDFGRHGGDSGIVLVSQAPGSLDASDTTSFLRDRREPLVGHGCREPGGAPLARCPGRCGPTCRTSGSGLSRPSEDCRSASATGCRRCSAAGTLDIAEPGAEFQVTDVVVNPKLPIRRLVAAGCSTDHCLVYYERGGNDHTWHVALFHWTPAATRFEWGGTAPGGLATIDDVRNAILSGAIKARPGSGSAQRTECSSGSLGNRSPTRACSRRQLVPS